MQWAHRRDGGDQALPLGLNKKEVSTVEKLNAFINVKMKIPQGESENVRRRRRSAGRLLVKTYLKINMRASIQ